MLLRPAAICLLTGAGSGIWISFSISRGLGRAVALAGAVAGGDLNQQVEVRSNDEIKDLVTALNSMVERLRIVVGEALSAAENVSSGSQELSAGARQQSAGAPPRAPAPAAGVAGAAARAGRIQQDRPHPT